MDPELAHLALALLSVPCGVCERVEKRFARWTNELGSCATTAGGGLKQALMSLMPRYSALDACHALSFSLAQPPYGSSREI
jgi:hypothetical protein